MSVSAFVDLMAPTGLLKMVVAGLSPVVLGVPSGAVVPTQLSMAGVAVEVPDLLRLVAVPAFAWAAYRDVRTRRVPNRLWYPLATVGLVAFGWELLTAGPFARRALVTVAAASVTIVIPLAYLLWRLGAVGGADAKALMTLAVLFPTYPLYLVPGMAFPAVRSSIGLFSLTVLTNTAIIGAVFPIALAIRNAAAGRFHPAMALGRPTPVERLPEEYGRLLVDGRTGVDIDALRMYLRWRGTTLAALRAAPDRHRDPTSITDTYRPGDGAVEDPGAGPPGDEIADGAGPSSVAPDAVTDAASSPAAVSPGDTGPARDDEAAVATAGAAGVGARSAPTGDDPEDPWGAARFLASLEGDAYGTTPATLRTGLDRIVTRETVWITPGLPFLAPMFLGLLVALTVGDLLTVALRALGVV